MHQHSETNRSPPDRLRPPNDDTEWMLRRIWDRVNRKNMHFMLCIVGEEGSGKSYTAMKIASAIDPTFDADRCIFDIVELLKVLRDDRHEPGQFYVLDEAGVQFGKRTWQERSQILANQALQLIRNHNLGLIFTLPSLGDLDSQTQRRLQAFFEMTDKIEGEHVRGKMKILDPDRTDQTGEVYKWFPRRRRDGKLLRITSFGFSPPPAGLTEPYEARKREFQEQVYDETIRRLTGEDDEDDSDDLSPSEVVERLKNGDDITEVISYHGTTGEPYLDPELLELKYDLTQRKSSQVKKLAQKDDDIDIDAHA